MKNDAIQVPDFFDWCEAKGFDLPEIKEVPDAKPATSESGSARRSVTRSHQLPPAAGRGLYPKGYFMPSAADTLVYDKDKD